MSYDHDADFTPHFEQYRQCLADHVIDCLGFWDALKFNSKVIGMQQQFQGAQGMD